LQPGEQLLEHVRCAMSAVLSECMQHLLDASRQTTVWEMPIAELTRAVLLQPRREQDEMDSARCDVPYLGRTQMRGDARPATAPRKGWSLQAKRSGTGQPSLFEADGIKVEEGERCVGS